MKTLKRHGLEYFRQSTPKDEMKHGFFNLCNNDPGAPLSCHLSHTVQ